VTAAPTPGNGGNAWDAIVVGAGHNGLTAAAYLARAGLRVVVVEARGVVGGAAVTEDLGGVRVPALAHTVGRLKPSVVRELELAKHGLALVAPEVRVFAPQPEGRAVTLFAELNRTWDALRTWSADDATSYVAFDNRVRSLARFLADLGDEAPPDVRAPGFGDALLGLRLGRAFRGLGRDDGRTILRVLAMAVADFTGEWFAGEPIRAVTAWRGVRYTAMGPWSAGSTAVLLGDAAGNDGGGSGETVFARGGPSAVAESLAAAARAAGAEIRLNARVAQVTTRDGAVTGVALASGEELAAPAVVSGLDPKRLLTTLVDPVVVGPSMRWRAGNIRTPGSVAKVNLVLDGLPSFTAAGDDARLLRGRILVGASSIDDVERSFDPSKYGLLPSSPVLEATIPSLVDPSLVAGAKDGTHVMSVIAQWMPAGLSADDWSQRREEVGDLVIRTLETVAPGLGRRVRARQVLAPADLEREYGLTGGHPLHAEPALDSFFLWRPLLGWARYRMPVHGLYLAGSGAHPGGGVTAVPGRNAAREVVADLRKRRR
jgi:phytoene dehydrogenase-like protein